jgi:site-specific DNA recombinase
MMAIVAPPWSVRVWRHCGTSRRGARSKPFLSTRPDRLSRKYAYQVLLAEELARCGVELIFLRAPCGATAEDQLLVQFQGRIAEYERAPMAERSRRGKRHRAQQGSINVRSGAPYGYRYVKKTDTSAAYYEVVESEAEVVRFIFDAYTRQGLSIGAIADLLNQREVPTRTRHSRWERPIIWRMLHNPAYAGRAFYGKTELCPRRRITRRLRQRALCSRDRSFRERPRQEWIETRYRLWSAKQPSLWRKSSSRKIRGFLPHVPSNHP